MKLLNKFSYLLLLYLWSIAACAIELTVKDQSGNALANAIVAIKTGTDENKVNMEISTAIMDQQNKTFVPHVLPVRAGTLVSFPNSDDIRHHVYSFSPAKKFQIKLYSGEPSSPIKFDVPGVVVLGCNIHDVMQGYIYVTSSEHFTKTNQEGKATLEISDDDILEVWHPNIKKINKPLSFQINELKTNSSGYDITITTIDKKRFREPKNDLERKFQSLRK